MSIKNLRSEMHIDPAKGVLYSIPDSDNHGDLLIRPIGTRQFNELGDTVYVKGASVPYHDHTKGCETFLIDGGSAEVYINKKKCVIERGDIVHIVPYVHHGYKYLEEGTIWREMFQDMDMYNCVEDKHTLRAHTPECLEDEEFKVRRYRGLGTLYRETPPLEEVSKYDIPSVRPKGWAISSFAMPGAVFNLKVGRWETDGLKEIWEILPENGLQIEWNIPHNSVDLFLVMEGAVHAKTDAEEFTAKKRDIINIHQYFRHTLTVVEEGTQLYAYNVQGELFRLMERLKAEEAEKPGFVRNWSNVEPLLRQCNLWTTGYRQLLHRER